MLAWRECSMSSTEQNGTERLLLHACCGPCSLEPVRIFAEENIDFAIDYYNPNIFPQEEYEHRLATIKEYVANPEDIELIEGSYDPETWEREVAVHGFDRPARCRACYRLRFEQAAKMAAERGFSSISTTLTISPYQFTDIILEELQAAAERHGLKAICRDFRECYPEATRRSKALGMYRQNYCGCRFSITEAAEQRAAQKAQREREKRVKHAALLIAAAEGAYNQKNQL